MQQNYQNYLYCLHDNMVKVGIFCKQADSFIKKANMCGLPWQQKNENALNALPKLTIITIIHLYHVYLPIRLGIG